MDIVKRLRGGGFCIHGIADRNLCEICRRDDEAADVIERLTEALEDEKAARLAVEKTNVWKLDNERLRAAAGGAARDRTHHTP